MFIYAEVTPPNLGEKMVSRCLEDEIQIIENKKIKGKIPDFTSVTYFITYLN